MQPILTLDVNRFRVEISAQCRYFGAYVQRGQLTRWVFLQNLNFALWHPACHQRGGDRWIVAVFLEGTMLYWLEIYSLVAVVVFGTAGIAILALLAWKELQEFALARRKEVVPLLQFWKERSGHVS